MKYKKTAAFAVVVSIFLGVLFLGACLSRSSDDEAIYTALAAKIQSAGSNWLPEYNLRGVSIESAGLFWRLERSENGNLLKGLSQSGVNYYDTPLYFNQPLFPLILCASHELLNQPLHFVVLKERQPMSFHADQLYTAFPNALFSVILLAGIFVLGRRCFDGSTGLLAAAICLTSPVFLVVAFKTWSDLVAASILVWSIILWREWEGSRLRVIFSGVFFALAVLTRTSVLFAAPLFFSRRWRSMTLWAICVAILTFPWFFAVYRAYGSPFYFPEAQGAKESVKWLRELSHPWYFYLVNIAYLSPLFLGALFSIKKSTGRLFLWVVFFIVPLSLLIYSSKPLGLEDRYLLPCYPALALLAAHSLMRLKQHLPLIPYALFLGGFMAWSVRTGLLLVLSRESLKFTPF